METYKITRRVVAYLSQLISVWWSDGILAALEVVSMAAPLKSSTPPIRDPRGDNRRGRRRRDVDSNRQEWRAGEQAGWLRVWLACPTHFCALFVHNNSARTAERACVPSSPLRFCWRASPRRWRQPSGLGDAPFLGPKAK